MPAQHSAVEAMAPIDQLLFRGERDSARRPTTLALYVLERSPEWHDVEMTFERASREFPRLRQRVVEPTGGVGPAHWVTDPDFDLTYHVRRARLPNGGKEDEPADERANRARLLKFVEPELMSPLDVSRPLWEVTLVDGLSNGQAVLIFKASHAVSDGLGGMQLNALIFDETRELSTRPMPHRPLAEDVTPDELALDNLRKMSRSISREWRTRASDFIAKGIRALAAPSDVSEYVDSLRRTMDTSALPSPLLAGRGIARRAILIDVPVDSLKKSAHALGGSLNDAYLAAISGGLQRYHERMGCPAESLPMAIPISTRKPGDEIGGNHFAGTTLAAPLGESDNAKRIASIRSAVRAARDERALGFADDLAGIMVALPAAAMDRLAASMPVPDIQASNVPGPREPIYMAGARVERMIGLGPLPGVAAMVVMISYCDTCSIAVNYDPVAITNGSLFETCLQEAVDEILTLEHPSASKSKSEAGGAA